LPVPSGLNVPVWRAYLQTYDDVQLCDFLDYGWPVGYDYDTFTFPKSDSLRNQTEVAVPPSYFNLTLR